MASDFLTASPTIQLPHIPSVYPHLLELLLESLDLGVQHRAIVEGRHASHSLTTKRSSGQVSARFYFVNHTLVNDVEKRLDPDTDGLVVAGELFDRFVGRVTPNRHSIPSLFELPILPGIAVMLQWFRILKEGKGIDGCSNSRNSLHDFWETIRK